MNKRVGSVYPLQTHPFEIVTHENQCASEHKTREAAEKMLKRFHKITKHAKTWKINDRREGNQ